MSTLLVKFILKILELIINSCFIVIPSWTELPVHLQVFSACQSTNGLPQSNVTAWRPALKLSTPKMASKKSTGKRHLLDFSILEFLIICRAVDGGIPFTQKSSFRYEVVPPRMRLKRDVLFSYEDLIVSFGGVAALFLGLNLWDFSGFIYFLISSLVKYFVMKIKKNW